MTSNNEGTHPGNALNGKAETLCSYCGKACVMGCSWAESLTPVEGWNAYRNKNGWMVVSCPEYATDDHQRRSPKDLNTEGCVKLLEAMMRNIRDDYARHPKSRVAIERLIRNPEAKYLFFFSDPESIIAGLRSMGRHKA